MSIPQRIKDLANKVRNEIYGKDVRESIAESMEVSGETAEEAKDRSVEAHDITQNLLDESFDSSIINQNFEQRLDDEIQQMQPELNNRLDSVDTQLAQNEAKLNKQGRTNDSFATVIFDDGDIGDYDVMFPYLQGKGIRGVSALLSDRIVNPKSWYLGMDEIEEMQAYGWQFLSHTIDHPNLTTITRSEVDRQFRVSKETLESFGIEVEGIVYPLNFYNNTALEIARKYYKYAFARDEKHLKKFINYEPINQYAIYRLTLESPLTTNKRFIDEAFENDGWLVFMGHGGYYRQEARPDDSVWPGRWDKNIQHAKDNIEYALSLGMEFGTAKEGIERFGNNITIGDDDESESNFYVGQSGKVRGTSLLHIRNDNIDVSTPLTDFEQDKTTISAFMNIDNAGFPEEVGGTLETYRYKHDALGYQLWYPHNTQNIYKRIWNANLKYWFPFETETHIKMLKPSEVDVSTPMTEFTRGKISIVAYQDNDNMEGFPENNAGTLMTYRTHPTNDYINFQIWTPYLSSKQYIRYWNPALSNWRAWPE